MMARQLLQIADATSTGLAAWADERELDRAPVPDIASAFAALGRLPRGAVAFVASRQPATLTPHLPEFAALAAQRDLCLGVLMTDSDTAEEALALRLGRPRKPLAAGVHLQLGLGSKQRQRRSTTASSAGELRQLVTQPRTVTLVEGHGGQHTALGHGLYLCSRPDRAEPVVADGVMACFGGAPCRVSQAGPPVAASEVRSAILVLLSCLALSPGGHDMKFNAGTALLANEHLLCLLATVRVATALALDVDSAYYALGSGEPLGAAANSINRLRLKRGLLPELLCFGDAELRLEPTLDAVAARREGERWRLELEEPDGDVDVWCQLDGLPSRPLVVVQAEPPLIGGILQEQGRLSLSLAQYSTPPLVRLLEASQIEREARCARLLADAATLADVLELWRPDESRAREVLAAAAALRAILAEWRARRIPWGHVVSSQELTRLLSELDSARRRLARAASDLAAREHQPQCSPAAGGARPMSFLHATAALRTTEACSTLAEPCPYCGGVVDESTQLLGAERQERALGCCRSCGILYDSAAHGTKWIGAEPALRAGSNTRVRLSIDNPTDDDVYALCSVKLWGHHSSDSVVSEAVAMRLEPGMTQPCELELAVPATFAAGVTRIVATTVVDAQLSFMQMSVNVHGPRALQVL